jgi:signal peptidase I
MSEFGDAALGPVDAVKCELASEVLRSSGRLRLRVTGWSMLPTVWPGDILMIDQTSAPEISAGDIVLFARDRRLCAHRVVHKTQSPAGLQIVTQGDSMPLPDPFFTESELLGKVSLISRAGKSLVPTTRLGLPGRAVAAVVRRSTSAARIIVAVHELGQSPQEPAAPCQS